MRWPSRSSIPCRTLPASRPSSSAAASRSIRPSRRSAALSNTAPPSELALGTSNVAVTGRSNSSGNSTQGVVIMSRTRRPPSVKESCLNTAFLSHGGLRATHSSRIIRVSPHYRSDQPWHSAREWEYTCDGLEWAYGSAASMPRSFLARDVPGTRHDIEIGDTLALPVPATGSPPGRLRLQGYITPLIVHGGFVPALGARLDSLKSALKESAEGT